MQYFLKVKELYNAPTMAKYQIACETSFATSKVTSDGCYEITDFDVYNDAYQDIDENPLGDSEFD